MDSIGEGRPAHLRNKYLNFRLNIYVEDVATGATAKEGKWLITMSISRCTDVEFKATVNQTRGIGATKWSFRGASDPS